MNRIIVEDVSFSYGKEREIFKSLCVEFDSRPTAIIGQNGSGKSTLMKLIKGLLHPNCGKIIINGLRTADHTAAQLAPLVGLVFQNPDEQICKSDVLSEVMFGPENIGQTKEEARRNSLKALETLGLTHTCSRHPMDLNVSERKLVAIASVIAMKPDIVIFDEPTMALDAPGKKRIKELIKNLIAEGRLVLCILHDMAFAAEMFERIIVLREGSVHLDGNPREVFSEREELRKAGADIPPVSMLAKKLGVSQTILSVGELVDALKKDE